jgi:hypothetical protein
MEVAVMRHFAWLTLSLLALASPQFLAQEPAAGQPQSSEIWLGRDAEFEEYLRTAPIERTEGTSVGTQGIRHAIFKPGGLVAGAAVRNILGKRDGFFESYKSEIAAYKLDRMLELNMVPPTVERKYEGKDASFQVWVADTIMLRDVNKKGGPRDPNPDRWNQNLHRAQVFDYLTGNIDNNEGNWLFDKVWNFYKIDCSRCFTETVKIKFEVKRDIKRIDRPFFDRVKALDRDAVRKEIGEYLTENNALPRLFTRRDAIVNDFEALAKQNGPDQVFETWRGQGK